MFVLTRRKKIWLAILLAILIFFWWSLPRTLFSKPTSYVIEDADGNLLNAVIAADGQWRFPYDENVPQRFIDCITTYEDKRFYSHPGVDVIALGRAMRSNMFSKAPTQGGSTISMQVIRLSQNNSRRNIWNKLKESWLAVRLECSYSKKEIIALYASNAPFGSNIVGLDAASWRYYGRSADKLSWGEMATLAVLPNSPSLVHPGKNRDQLLQKRNRLLDQLLAAKKLSPGDCDLAKQEELPIKPLPLPQNAPHLLQRFKKENKEGSTRIRSTIDGELQKNVTQVLSGRQPLLQSNGINNICALVLDVETGNTLAYVGNVFQPANKEMESDVDVINAPRSPGSALKPVLYAAMMSDGLLLPNALIPDVPTRIGGYTPENFDLGYDGAVPASRALARSLNIPAVKLLQQYKYQRFYETLQRCGITTLNRPADFYGLSMILGGCEVKMWDIAGLYASLARMLNHQNMHHGTVFERDIHPPRYISKAVDKDDKRIAHFPLDATAVYQVFQAMQEVMRPGEEGLWQQFSSSKKIAWKTGTSFGFRDGWAIGITPKHVVAVWTGNTDGEGRAGLVGVQTAAPVMFDIFRLLPDDKWFATPAYNISLVPICRQSGFRANIDCRDVDTLPMPPLGDRSPLCPYHKIIHLEAGTNLQVNESCVSPANMQHVSWFVLPPSMEYYYKQRNQDYKLLPLFKPGCVQANPVKLIELIYPQPDAKIFVPLEVNGVKGSTVFQAAHRNSEAKIFWSLDNNFAGTTQRYHQLAISPSKGKHTITLTDEAGNSISRNFEITDTNK